MIVVLAGGVGAARFLQGVVQVVPQEQITVIANTGDDREFYGLHVSPDVDIVMYTLAGLVDERNGWGIANDTYYTMQQLTAYGNEDWFALGDRDLATHIHRTNLLRQGKTFSEITDDLRKHLGLQVRILPMSDQPIATHIQTLRGLIHFEEYFVKHRSADEVQDVVFVGADKARPAPGVLDAIKQADAILIAPSNPIVSIGSILSVPGIHDALHEASGMVIAVSPIVGGAPIKGPADKLMKGVGREVSAVGVASCYRDFLDVMVIDEQDIHLVEAIEDLGIPTIVTNTIMSDLTAKTNLAQTVLHAALQRGTEDGANLPE
jgi:LPPG:FO 2-phospho-L-lactate transferase